MWIKLYLILVTGCTITISATASPQTPYFRILAPQFLCSGSDSSDFVPPNSITVALQTRGGERLTYRVQIFFKLLDGFKSQRHTLSVWRSIRVLEKKIRDTKAEISTKNQIDILNEELIEGVEYTFTIIGVDAEGYESPGQNFTITYRGDSSIGFDQQSGTSSADISFLLVGSWTTYRNMPFLMQGVIIFCEANPDYKFIWNMAGLDAKYSDYLKTPSKSLFLPKDILKPGASHQISVKVVNADTVLAQGSGTLKVLSRDFAIQLVPNNQSIGLSREIIYKVYLENFDAEHDKINITWSCQSLSSKSVDLHDRFNMKLKHGNRSAHLIFSKVDTYYLTVSVLINGIMKNDSALVQVAADIIPSVEFMAFDPFSVVTDQVFSTAVYIHYLTPKCLAEWFLVLDSTGNIENGYGLMNINDLEENFLSELIEYENNTISYKVILTAPGEYSNSTGIRRGRNLFRLMIMCPPLINEDDLNSTMPNTDLIISYVELILNSNDPPSVEELDVSPNSGYALKTLFKFSTGPSIDSPDDYPMRYKFFYLIAHLWVLVGDFYENTVTSAELPFSEHPIETKYEVCDSRGACTTVKGPKVKVILDDKMTASEIDNKLEALKGSLARQDYEEFFARAVSCIWTIYAMERKDYIKKVDRLVKDLLDQQLGSNQNVEDTVLKQWKFIAEKLNDKELLSRINNFLKNSES